MKTNGSEMTVIASLAAIILAQTCSLADDSTRNWLAKFREVKRHFSSLTADVDTRFTNTDVYYLKLPPEFANTPRLRHVTSHFAAKADCLYNRFETEPDKERPESKNAGVQIKNHDMLVSVDSRDPDDPEPQYMTLDRSRKGFPSPLDFGYTVAGVWICDLIGSSSIVSGNDVLDVKFGQLHSITFDTNEGSHLNLQVAEQMGNLVVQCEQSTDGGQNRLIFRVDKAEKFGDQWIPTQGTLDWNVMYNGKYASFQKKTFALSNILVGKVISNQFETPKPLPGSRVKDNVKGIFYTVGIDGKWTETGRVRAKPASITPPVLVR